jgi:hypothetical protein
MIRWRILAGLQRAVANGRPLRRPFPEIGGCRKNACCDSSRTLKGTGLYDILLKVNGLVDFPKNTSRVHVRKCAGINNRTRLGCFLSCASVRRHPELALCVAGGRLD